MALQTLCVCVSLYLLHDFFFFSHQRGSQEIGTSSILSQGLWVQAKGLIAAPSKITEK